MACLIHFFSAFPADDAPAGLSAVFALAMLTLTPRHYSWSARLNIASAGRSHVRHYSSRRRMSIPVYAGSSDATSSSNNAHESVDVVYKLGERVITQGDSGTDVYELQQLLNRYGYLQHNATGYFGSQTRSALYQYQSDCKHLIASGALDMRTAQMLLSTPLRTRVVHSMQHIVSPVIEAPRATASAVTIIAVLFYGLVLAKRAVRRAIDHVCSVCLRWELCFTSAVSIIFLMT